METSGTSPYQDCFLFYSRINFFQETEEKQEWLHLPHVHIINKCSHLAWVDKSSRLSLDYDKLNQVEAPITASVTDVVPILEKNQYDPCH